jgi:hypothetical protein
MNQLDPRKRKVIYAEWIDAHAFLEQAALRRSYHDAPGIEGGVARLLREITEEFLFKEFPCFKISHPIYLATQPLPASRKKGKDTRKAS